MKTAILFVLLVSGAGAQSKPVVKQVQPPVVKPELDSNIISCDVHHEHCVSWSSASTLLPSAIWTHEVKEGVYTMTFTDPQNHWRCFISSIKEDNPRSAFDVQTSAFTVTCYDTTAGSNKPNESTPTPSKGAGK